MASKSRSVEIEKGLSNLENTNETKTAMPSDEMSYSIFDYFKEHPSIAIALFSGFWAFGTFVAEVCFAIENNAFFSYWDLSLSNVFTKSFLQGNTVVFSLLQFAFQALFSMYILSSFDVHISNFSYMIYTIFQKKELARDLKKTQKRLARIRREYDTLKITSANEEHLKAIYKEITSLEKEVEQSSNENQLQQRILFELSRKCWSIILELIIIPVILYFVLTWITLSVRITSMISIFVNSLVYTSIPLVLACLGCSGKIKRIKKQAKNDYKNNTETFVKTEIKEYPNRIFFGQSLRDMLPNHTIGSLFGSLITVFVVSLFATSLTTPITKQTSNEYPIVMVDNKAYVVIYETSEKVILEEATINGSTVVINTKKQWITNKENIHYEIKSFEKVVRLKDYVERGETEDNPNYGD